MFLIAANDLGALVGPAALITAVFGAIFTGIQLARAGKADKADVDQKADRDTVTALAGVVADQSSQIAELKRRVDECEEREERERQGKG